MHSSHDRGFVAATPEELLRILSRPESYDGLWGDRGRLGLRAERAAAPRVVRSERDAVEMRLGDAGALIWVVEPFQEGTIVHAILEPTRSGPRRLLRARARLRTALVALWRRFR